VTDAQLITGGPRPAIRFERQLPDPPTVVWRAITDRDELKAWFPCDVAVSGGRWRPGAAISFTFPPEVADLTITGEVFEVDEPTRLAYSFGQDILRFELSPRDGGTLLVLIDELPPSTAARSAAGWEECLNLLAGSKPAPDAWRSRFTAYAAAFQPALGPQEGPPAEFVGSNSLSWTFSSI
jgi:uncharacterized protein YndB with AHSA1/START domain